MRRVVVAIVAAAARLTYRERLSLDSRYFVGDWGVSQPPFGERGRRTPVGIPHVLVRLVRADPYGHRYIAPGR